jgi:hypothetical protein
MSAKYLRNAFASRSRSFVVNSTAVGAGQPCAGRNTFTKKSTASCPRVLQTICRKFAISWRTCVACALAGVQQHAQGRTYDHDLTILDVELGEREDLERHRDQLLVDELVEAGQAGLG